MTAAAGGPDAGQRSAEPSGPRRPLGHLRVIEVAEMVPGPYAGRLLVDLGAQVTKVERPRSGDAARHVGPFPDDSPDPEASGLYAYLNRGKRSATLEWSTPSGRDLLRRLLADADILLADESLGLSYEELGELVAALPQLVAVSVTSFGLVGPRAHWRGSHAAACAYGGLTLYIGEQEREPISPPHQLGAFQGGLAAANAAMLAVLARGGPHGRGQVVDIAVTDVLSSIHTGNAATHWVFGSRSWMRHGRRAAAGLYPNTMLRCNDGWFRIQAMSRKEWRGLLDMIGNPAWGDEERFQDRIKMQELYADELDEKIEGFFLQHSKQELFEMSQERELPFAPVREMHEMGTEEQLEHRGLFGPTMFADGREVRMAGSPYEWERSDGTQLEAQPVRRAPRLGEHNRAVYEETLGLSRAEFDELRTSGVI